MRKSLHVPVRFLPVLRKQPNPSRVHFLSILGGHLPTNTGEMSFDVLTGAGTVSIFLAQDFLSLGY